MKREMARLIHNPLYGFCMVVAPIACIIFFTTLMQSGLPHDLPIGLVDNDRTVTTRNLARNLDAFQAVRIVGEYPSVTEARKAVQRGDIYGFYYIPDGVTREAQRQEIPTVSFYTNYTYLVAGSLLYRDMRMMSELASGAASRTVLYAKGVTERQAMAFLQPIVVEAHPIGNPWLNYNVYLSNTLIPGVLSLFIFLITAYSIGQEIKRGTGGELLALAGNKVWRAMLGKLLPQTLIFLAVGVFYVLYLYVYLHFPCHCGVPVMLLVMLLMVLASQGMGVLMIAALPSPRFGLSFASLWGVVSFSICGMSYPVMAMHPMLQGAAMLFPLRHYFLLYVNCALDGYPLLNAWPYVLALVLFALLPLLLLKRLRHVLTRVAYLP